MGALASVRPQYQLWLVELAVESRDGSSRSVVPDVPATIVLAVEPEAVEVVERESASERASYSLTSASPACIESNR